MDEGTGRIPVVVARVAQPGQAPGRHRLLLALQRERRDRLGAHVLADPPQRRVGHQDLAGRRGLLEARGDVHGVADECPQGAVAHDDLARVDPGPRREAHPPAARDLGVQRVEARAELERGADGAERVVFVERREPKTAITASPAKDATRPPCAPTARAARS